MELMSHDSECHVQELTITCSEGFKMSHLEFSYSEDNILLIKDLNRRSNSFWTVQNFDCAEGRSLERGLLATSPPSSSPFSLK